VELVLLEEIHERVGEEPVLDTIRLAEMNGQLQADGVTSSRFRIWPEGEAEPGDWLCSETDAGIDLASPRHTAASFSLFQHTGVGSEWSDIKVASLD
jgi:hypothetical protein